MRITSKGPVKITKVTIDAEWKRRQKDQRVIIRDKERRGLALIVNATSMTWSYAYRPRGTDPVTGRRWPNRAVTIGNPETHSPDDARAEANRIKGSVTAGGDPAAEKKAGAEAMRLARGSTLERLAEQYAKALPHRPKMRGAGNPSTAYVAIELAQVRLALAAMDAAVTPARDLTATGVRNLLASDTKEANLRARFGAMVRFLDWCVDEGHIDTNVCTQIPRQRRPKAPQARAHYLTVPELARLWRAAEQLDEGVWRDVSRFLIAVPCRQGEAAHVDWRHIDLAAAEWRQPGKLTKNGDAHRLHLHPLVLEILERRRHAAALVEADGDERKTARILAAGEPRTGLVFPAPLSGRPIDTFSDLKAALTEATEPDDETAGSRVAGWTWHDFRRSFATALGEAGIPEAVADAVLNHRQSATRGGVMGVYQRASRWPEQVKAMQLWGRLLVAAIDGREAGADVLQLHAGTAA